MKTILVPTDFSRSADNALAYAVAFSKATNAKLILLHAFIVDYPESDIPGEIVTEEISRAQRKADQRLKSMCLELSKSNGIRCSYISKEGEAMDVILEVSRKVHPGFIIMGTKGASGIKGVVFGSNTAAVIEKSTHAVIAIPDGVKFNGVKKITYATNYYTNELYAIRKLVEIADSLGASINILHVADGEYIPEGENETLRQFVLNVSKRFKYKKFFFQLIYGKSVENGLKRYLEKNSTDLLAMSTQYRSLWGKLFGKSITRKMAYNVNVPLLAFHHKKESVMAV